MNSAPSTTTGSLTPIYKETIAKHNKKMTVCTMITLMFLSVMVCVVNGEEAMVPTSFRKRGYLATGLSYGHVHFEIDLNKIIDVQNKSEYALALAIARLNMFFLNGTDVGRYETLYKGMTVAFKPSRKMVEEVMTLFEDQLTTHQRNKRQMVAAAAAVGTLFNLGLGLYNRYEIAELHQEMQKAREDRIHIVELLKDEATKFNSMLSVVKQLNTTMAAASKALQKIRSDLDTLGIFTIVEHEIVTYNWAMTLWYHAILELLQGRLSPHLLKPSAVEQAMKHVLLQANEQGLHALFTESAGFFRADVSYLMSDNIIHVYVHLPLIEAEPLLLLEYVNAPVMLSKPNGPLMFIDTKGKALAISDSTNNGLEIDLVRLVGCSTKNTHLGKIYLCPNTNLARKDITQTCLGTLHGGRYDLQTLKVRCGVYFEDVEEFAVQISSNIFMFYSKHEVKLSKTCKNGSEELMLSGLHRLELAPFCKLFSLNYVFTPRISLHLEEDLVYFPRSVTFTYEDIPLPTVMDVYERYNQANVKLPEKIKLEEVDDLLKAIQTDTLPGHAFWGPPLTILNWVLLLGVIGYLTYNHVRYLLTTRANRRPREPAHELILMNQ